MALTVLLVGTAVTYGLVGRRATEPGGSPADASPSEPVEVAMHRPSGDAGPSLASDGRPRAASSPSKGGGDASAEAGARDADVAEADRADAGGQNGIKRSVRIPSAIQDVEGTRLVRIVPDPPAARVFIDDRDYGEYGPAHVRGLEIGIGTHKVKLVPRDSFYDETVFSFHVPAGGADAGVLIQRRPLKLRPARVRVNTNAPGATVSIPHRERSRANQVFLVRLNAREERVQMIIDAEGYRSEVREVVLRAGGEYSLDVTLEPETEADGLATRAVP